MCIYCTTSNYRKIYENHIGPIPKNDAGQTYDIHHIDGDRKNNSINNLKAVSLEEHYQIHYNQQDWGACFRIAQRLKLDPAIRSEFISKAQLQRVVEGTHHFLKNNRSENHNKNSSKAQKRLVNEGIHHWTTANHAQQTKKIQCEKVSNSTHHLLGGKVHRKLVEEGKHHFLSGEISRRTNARRSADGSAAAHMTALNNKRMADGTHQNLLNYICPHCEKQGKGPSFKFAHFDNCVRIKGVETVTCPHCGTIGSARGPIMNRWHFDNCINQNPEKRWTHSQETRDNMSANRKGKSSGWKLNEQSREKQKEAVKNALTGKNKVRIQCPHCLKIGGKPAMTRFHMNNCKEIKL